ncbi:MAG: tRNA (adenosine(37)-N6)-threonylcarbamoyltransferase complex ATPase subunit type 1 TsaE [Actinomycetes bacterium]
MTGVRRLVHADTTGLLVPRPPWSVEVVDLEGPDTEAWLREAEAWARTHDALDLRSTTPLPGGRPVAPDSGEHVRTVPVRLPDADATRALGRRVASALRPGDLVVMSGPLGAGKTTFTQGIGEALGVRGRVTSPTFVLAREHRAGPDGSVPLVHVDAYRLRDAAEAGRPVDLDDLDLDTALEHAVTVVEWGAGLVDRLADSWLEVRLDRPDDPTESAADGVATGDVRVAVVLVHGTRWLRPGFGPV